MRASKANFPDGGYISGFFPKKIEICGEKTTQQNKIPNKLSERSGGKKIEDNLPSTVLPKKKLGFFRVAKIESTASKSTSREGIFFGFCSAGH